MWEVGGVCCIVEVFVGCGGVWVQREWVEGFFLVWVCVWGRGGVGVGGGGGDESDGRKREKESGSVDGGEFATEISSFTFVRISLLLSLSISCAG